MKTTEKHTMTLGDCSEEIPMSKEDYMNVTVTAACNGYHGGDAGHGGKAYICLDFDDILIDVDLERDSYHVSKIEISGMGDWEIGALHDAFQSAYNQLHELIYKKEK